MVFVKVFFLHPIEGYREYDTDDEAAALKMAEEEYGKYKEYKIEVVQKEDLIEEASNLQGEVSDDVSRDGDV